MIGDYIDDVYQYGSVIGVANEDPVLKFRPSDQNVTTGGVGYCKALMESFCPEDTLLDEMKLSTSTICRFVDTGYNRCVFTVDTEPTVCSDNVVQDVRWYIENHKPDLIYLHSDGRSKDIDSMLAKLIEKLETPLAIDMPMSYTTVVELRPDYVKSYYGSAMERPKPTVLGIATHPQITITYKITGPGDYDIEASTWMNPPLDPVDTCGAGDTLFSCFLAQLVRYNRIGQQLSKSATKQFMEHALSAAYLTCSNQGTYVPEWEEVQEKRKELFDATS
jgi:hypothetical protein